MRVTLLGTGAAMPTGSRMQAGYLIERPDRSLLVDCGSGVLHRLARTDPGYAGVDAVLLTHHHLDHVADLCPLLKARWLADAPQLPVFGPPGTEALVAGLLDVHDYLAPEVSVRVADIGMETREVDGWSLRLMETRHSMQCFAYRISSDGAEVTLSGDSEAMPELAAFADGSDLLIHDCSFPDEVDVSNHPTPSQLGQALAGTEIDRVVLTHLYPHTIGRFDELRASVAEAFDGRVDVLPDLATIELGSTQSS